MRESPLAIPYLRFQSRVYLLPLLLVAFAVQSEPARASEYAWPMAIAPALTSTFGEYRPGRMHAGLDLKTWGREGVPVLAAADGHFWRVRTSPWGYGKVVYLALADGRTAVYAHLSDFIPSVNAVVRREQARRGAYSVNLFLERGQIPVRRGEVIGYSGRTGIGYPHLHFELRDDAQRPLNPLRHGLRVVDTLPPTFRSIALIPLDAESTADNQRGPALLPLVWQRARRLYSTSRVPEVEGRIGVAVSLFDRADASQLSNRLAPYRLRLLVDGRVVFETTYDAFGYGQVHHASLDLNFLLNAQGLGEYHNLYLSKGNRLPFYGSYRAGDGALHAGVRAGGHGSALAPGSHELVVQAEDASGNLAEASIRLAVTPRLRVVNAEAVAADDSVRLSADLVGRGAKSLLFEGSGDGGRRWTRLARMDASAGTISRMVAGGSALYRIRTEGLQAPGTYQTCAPVVETQGPGLPGVLSLVPTYMPEYAIVRIGSDRVLGMPPRAVVRLPEQADRLLPVFQVRDRDYECVVPFEAVGEGPVQVAVEAVGVDGVPAFRTLVLARQRVPPEGGAVVSPDGMARAVFDSGKVYTTLFGRALPEAAATSVDLPVAGLAYRFSPDNVPFNGRAKLVMRHPIGHGRPELLGIYELKADSVWAFLGNEPDPEGGAVSAEVPYFSTYALLLDAVPPRVENVKPADGERVRGSFEISASVSDIGSGIVRDEDLEIRLDGLRLIVEYDPEEERITALPDVAPAVGEHRLEVVARDACGNTTRKAVRFVRAEE
jgi:hypothetical protein